jgi:hypothetical protein
MNVGVSLQAMEAIYPMQHHAAFRKRRNYVRSMAQIRTCVELQTKIADGERATRMPSFRLADNNDKPEHSLRIEPQ